MKMAKRDIAILMVLVAVMAVFCSYRFYFSGVLETVDAEEKKQASIQAEIDRVKQVAGTENQLENEVRKWASEITDLLGKYDISYRVEDGILWMRDIETDLAAGETLIQQYTVGESAVSTTVMGQGEFSGKTFTKGTTSYSFSYKVKDYASLKTFIDYIVSGDDGVKTLDSMSFTVNEITGETTGNVTMTVYSMEDGTVLYTPPAIDGVELGVPNIFGEPTGQTAAK